MNWLVWLIIVSCIFVNILTYILCITAGKEDEYYGIK
jgi:hypothetical protein